ncbi:MAG: NAD-dependent epimerase/dehydratase family protein [Spirochaetia bacterium]
MKLLITGGTGFIGQYVVTCALSYGYTVVLAIQAQEDIQAMHWAMDVEAIVCDLHERREDWFDFFGAPDAVIHLAWKGLPHYMSMHHIEENYMASYLFLKNLIGRGVKHVTVIGTCFEYGLQEGELQESDACEPVTTYGQAKYFLHQSLYFLQQHQSFSYKWVRLFYPYGPGSARSLLGQLDIAIKNNEAFSMSLGEQMRDYLPVEKVGEYILKIAIQQCVFGIVHCCSGVPISVRRFVEEYVKKSGSQISLKLGEFAMAKYEPLSFWGNTQRLNQALEAFERENKEKEIRGRSKL